MKVFRLSRKKYADTLSGKGAAKFGNRWNSKGIEMIYTAESRALAMAEVVVHISLAALPRDYMMIEIEIPNDVSIETFDTTQLPANWRSNPPQVHTQRIGDDFIISLESCVLKVPSVVVPGDYNFLINPHHPQFNKIKIAEATSFLFDERFSTL